MGKQKLFGQNSDHIKSILNVLCKTLLVVSIALPPGLMYAPTPAGANSGSDNTPAVSPEQAIELMAERTTRDAAKFNEEVEALDQILRGLRVGVHPLDPFGALSQRVVSHGPKARWRPTLKENLNIVIGNYLEIDEYLTQPELDKYLGWMFTAQDDGQGGIVQVLSGAEFSDQIKLAAHYGELSRLSQGKLKHLTKEVADRLGLRVDEALRFLEAKYNVFNNPQSPFRKLDKKLVEVLADFDDQARVIRARDAKHSTQPGYSTGNLIRKEELKWQPLVPTFSFFDAGRVVTEFSIPAQAVFFYGDYLIILEKDAFIADQGIHYISFIDIAKYESVLGKNGLPIFKLPFATQKPITDIRIANGKLSVQGESINANFFKNWSDMNQMFFDAYVNVIDPQTADAAAAKVVDFTEYLASAQPIVARSLGAEDRRAVEQAQLFEKHGRLMLDALMRQKALGKAENYADAAEKIGANYLQEQQFQLALKESAQRVIMNRSLLNRAQLLMAHIALPRPDGVPVMQKAFAHLAAAFSKKKRADLGADQYLREGSLQILNHPYARYGLPVATAALVGAINPEFASQFLYNMMAYMQASVLTVFGTVYDFAYHGYETIRQTFRGLNPLFMYDVVKTSGHYLAVGIGGLIGLILGPALVAHWSVNLLKLGYDLHEMASVGPAKGPLLERIFTRARTVLRMLNGKNFIEQQRALRAWDLRALSESMRVDKDENGDSKPLTFTDEQNAEVMRLIEKMEAEREAAANSTWLLRVKNSISKNGKKVWSWLRKKDVAAAKEVIKGHSTPEELAAEKIQTVGHAIKHFMMSWPTLTVSQTMLAKYFWNSWFLFRSFAFHPIVTTQSLLFPHSAFIAARDRNQLTLPTEFNGGRRYLWQYLNLQFFKTDHLEELRAWETKVLDVEAEIHKAAVLEAFRATVQLAQNSSDLSEIYKNGQIQNWSSGAIKKLSTRWRVFFRNYSSGIQQAATEAFLRDHFRSRVVPVLNLSATLSGDAKELARVVDLSDRLEAGDRKAIFEIKDRGATILSGLSISAAEATRYVQQAAKDTKALEHSKELASDGAINSMRRFFENNIVQKPITRFDRQNNRQVDRVFTVNEKLDDPQAVARGIRYVASGWKVSYPINIAAMVLLLAGVEGSDMLDLIHPEAMFSDQSFLYLSRYVVLGLALNSILGVVGGADLWMKVQMDEQHEGKFNERLTGKEAEMNMLRLWWHKSFGNPDNTLWQNHKHYVNRIVLPNMKAALFNYALLYFATVGRFDIGGYGVGYALAVTVPKFSFDMMMDQGFDLAASSYLTTRFPPELLAHPRVQEYINKQAARWRDFYNLGNKGYEVASNQLMENLQFISTDRIGSRSLERLLFGGWSAAEVAYQGLENAKGVLRPIPGVEQVLTACEKMLTNNMDPKLFIKTQVPPWLVK